MTQQLLRSNGAIKRERPGETKQGRRRGLNLVFSKKKKKTLVDL